MKLPKLILIFNLQLLLCINSFAQGEKIDSLKKVLPSLTDTARIDCLVELSKQYMILEMHFKHLFQPYRDTSLFYDSIAIEEAKKINYIHGIAESFVPKAAFQNHFLNNYVEGEKLARESLKWFERTGNKSDIEVSFFQVGINLFFQYKYERHENN